MPTSRIPTAFLLPAALALAALCAAAHAEVKLPAIIGAHMVLQRDMAVPIWGTAAPGEQVTVKFGDQTKAIAAGNDGKWLVKLDPLKLGEPGTLTVAGTNTLTIEDVLVGDVWIGSGQSNMDMPVGSYVTGDPVLAQLAAQTYPQIRLTYANKPWQIAEPDAIKQFSALLFSFGVPLHKELNVPIGLIEGAVGGTPSGRWLTAQMFAEDKACQEAVAKAMAAYSPEAAQALHERNLARYEQELAAWNEKAAEAKQQGTQPSGRAPMKPLPPVKPGELITGGTMGDLYNTFIKPLPPFGIRGVLWDQGESRTAVAEIDQIPLMGALIGGWRRTWGQGEFPFLYVQKPSGEGCAWDPSDPVTNQAQPFAPLPEKPEPNAGVYREQFVRIMQYLNTAMAISTDLGRGTHPTNKSGYGARAARVALGMVYGKKIEYYGPLYASHRAEGDKVRISYTHVGQGLAFKHGDKLQGFAVAGEDKVFHWADAVIDGQTVVVSSKDVPKPVAVRYAWASAHPWANLFNKDGLPAVEFRTDDWEIRPVQK